MEKRANHGWLSISIRWFLINIIFVSLITNSLFGQNQRSVKRFVRGDALRLKIWQPWGGGDGGRNINFDGDYLIDSRGYVFFPLLAEVKVINHTPTTLANELKDKFSAYVQDPVVIVKPLIRVTLLGAFRRPGTYLVSLEASLWELVD